MNEVLSTRCSQDAARIRRIRLTLPFRLGSVNCYLVQAGSGFVLIDTGPAQQRARLNAELAAAGCRAGSLALVILTHGDFDHTGNAAHLHAEYGAPMAMHRGDAGMAERGDMFWGRTSGNALIRGLAPLLFGFGKSQRFVPDLYVEDGFDLSPYGLAARVVHIPGHSSGSIGIVVAGASPGEGQALFCGDLLTNTDGPAINGIMDDLAAAHASVARLRELDIDTVYPGHGEPFPLERLPVEGQ